MATCGECMYFDWKTHKEKFLINYYWCKAFQCWRRVEQGACGQYTHTGGCFLTTACVEYRGLPDDCDELTELREYRDSYLRATDEGRELVEKYYSIAPTIVDGLAEREDKDEIYDYVYGVIQECVKCIKDKDYEKTLSLYKNMVLKLAEITEVGY